MWSSIRIIKHRRRNCRRKDWVRQKLKSRHRMKLAVMLCRNGKQRPGNGSALKTMNGWVYEADATYKRMVLILKPTLLKESPIRTCPVREEVLRALKRRCSSKKRWLGLGWSSLTDSIKKFVPMNVCLHDAGYRDSHFAFPRFSENRRQIYTVGNEQNITFKVLFLILWQTRLRVGEEVLPSSYGMVDLPSGKMKSREGTVVDADDLMQDMADEAERQTRELGKIDELSDAESKQLFENDRPWGFEVLPCWKLIRRNACCSIPTNRSSCRGFGGPFIQYTHAGFVPFCAKQKAWTLYPQQMIWWFCRHSSRPSLAFAKPVREQDQGSRERLLSCGNRQLCVRPGQSNTTSSTRTFSIFNEADPAEVPGGAVRQHCLGHQEIDDPFRNFVPERM